MERGSANERGYTYRWQKSAKLFLDEHPLCIFCEQQGHITAATVVDHIKPHRGDNELFWDKNNWQALCKPCHDSTKQRIERSGIKRIGIDGYPIADQNEDNDEDFYDSS
jgi:5-methylcytosine-specific restriction endonuclease McrA